MVQYRCEQMEFLLFVKTLTWIWATKKQKQRLLKLRRSCWWSPDITAAQHTTYALNYKGELSVSSATTMSILSGIMMSCQAVRGWGNAAARRRRSSRGVAKTKKKLDTSVLLHTHWLASLFGRIRISAYFKLLAAKLGRQQMLGNNRRGWVIGTRISFPSETALFICHDCCIHVLSSFSASNHRCLDVHDCILDTRQFCCSWE